MTIAIYCRVSTDEQALNGYGLDAQEEKCRALLSALDRDSENISVYREEGVSGTISPTERPAMSRLLTDIGQNDVTTVVTYGLDRLGRKTTIVLDVINHLHDQGCSFISVKESFDTETPQGRFVLTMFAAVSELEHGMIRQRVMAGQSVRRSKDGETGGQLPYGYRSIYENDGTRDGFEIDEYESDIVRQIFKARLQGKASYNNIAKQLNSEGIPSPKGGSWGHSTVRYIINNRRVYEGGSRNGSSVRYPAII